MKQLIGTILLLITAYPVRASEQLPLVGNGLPPVQADSIHVNYLKKGYSFAIEGGYHSGIGKVRKNFDYGLEPYNNSDGALVVQIINSYRFNHTLSLGIGAGFHKYEDMESLPVFLDVRLLFPSRKKVAAYLSLQTGIVFPSQKKIEPEYVQGTTIEHKNGFMLNPNLGLRIGKSSAFIINAGYMVYFRKEHHSGYHYFYSNGITRPVNQEIKTRTSYFTVRIGMMIN